MGLIPFNGADPTAIVSALGDSLAAENVVSLHFRADVARGGSDDWQFVQSVLGCREVYEAFKISSLPLRFNVRRTLGFEVIGTLANLLNYRRGHLREQNWFEEQCLPFELAKDYLDQFYNNDYRDAKAFTLEGAWCDWFHSVDWIEGGYDRTFIAGNGVEWSLLAVTGTE